MNQTTVPVILNAVKDPVARQMASKMLDSSLRSNLRQAFGWQAG